MGHWELVSGIWMSEEDNEWSVLLRLSVVQRFRVSVE